MSQVGLVQGEVLVGLQAGGDLSQRVGVTLVEALLLPKVLVLQHSSRSLEQLEGGTSTSTSTRGRLVEGGLIDWQSQHL